jgi:hypothetical protein
VTERALEALRALREAGEEARAAGELVAFLIELERVRLELLIALAKPEPAPSASPDRLLSAEEAAERIGMSVWWTRANRNALPIVRLPGGRYRFSAKALDRWLQRRAAS